MAAGYRRGWPHRRAAQRPVWQHAGGPPNTSRGDDRGHDPAEAPLWSLIMGKLSTSDYNDESAVKARHRMVAFFDRHLKNGASYAG